MSHLRGLEWFKKEIVPLLNEYELNYKFFEEGDFGPLAQFEFNSNKLGGNVDFWGLEWLGIFVWDYEKDEELINILLEPQEINEKIKALDEFKRIILSK